MPFSASIRLAQSSVSLSGITSARDLPCQVSRRAHIYRQSSGIDARPPDSHDFCPFSPRGAADPAPTSRSQLDRHAASTLDRRDRKNAAKMSILRKQIQKEQAPCFLTQYN